MEGQARSRAREVVRRLNFGERWKSALDPDMPVGIEMEADIYFLLRCENDRITNWDMFMAEEQALRRAAERRTHRDDDHAAQGDRRERA